MHTINMDVSQTHHSEQKKSGTKEYKLWFRISKTLGKTKLTHNDRKQVSACLELDRREISWEAAWDGKISGVMVFTWGV